MLEILLVIGAVVALLALGLLVVLLSWTGLAAIGLALIALGFAVGVPTAVYYHLQLYRCLHPRGQLRPRWWLSPIGYNKLLTDEERPRVMPWCSIGAAGLGVIIVGMVLFAMALIRLA